MKKKITIIFLLLIACSSDLPLSPELNIDLNNNELNTIQLDSNQKSLMNGVYLVIEGNDYLGDTIVGKWVRNRWCLYANHDVVFSINAGGFTTDTIDSITFSGYFRIVRSGAGSSLNLSISPNEGADFLRDNVIPDNLIIRNVAKNGKKVVLKRIRDLYNEKELIILAHRCGGRNSERLGVSENSLEMIKLSQYLGASGIELDVKITRDRKIIVFHDDAFSPRTVTGAYLLGNVKNFDLSQIKTFGRLINGEIIPTLEEALKTVIDSTDLSYVWLDLKDANMVNDVMNIQNKFMQDVINKGKKVKILMGIPSLEIWEAYLKSTNLNAPTTPALMEFDIGYVKGTYFDNVLVWAPRWTETITNKNFSDIHCLQKKVFTWTLDYYDYIIKFMQNDSLDGILSNYPSLIAGMHYSRK